MSLRADCSVDLISAYTEWFKHAIKYQLRCKMLRVNGGGFFDFREPADLGEDDREELMIMIII